MSTNWEQLVTKPSNSQNPNQNPNEGAFTSKVNNATVGDVWSKMLGPIGEMTGPILNQLPGMQTKAVNVPFLGGFLGRGMADPLAKAGEYGAEAVATPIMDLATKGKVGAHTNNFMAPSDFKTIQNGGLPAIANTLGTGLSAGLAATGAKGAANLPETIWNAPKMLPLITKGGAGKAIGAATQAATNAGASSTGPDLVTEFKQAVEDKLGGPGGMAGDPALQKSYGKMLQVVTGRGDITPETLAKIDPSEFTGEYSPTDLVKGRQNIVTRFGYSPTDEGTLDQKVANIARDVFSKRAKDLAPGLATADKAYSLHSDLGKMAPNIVRALGIGGGATTAYTIARMLLGANGSSDQNP